jgi:hypothetical protein
VTRSALSSIALCLLGSLLTQPASAQLLGGIVHDPINGAVLIEQRVNQMTQLKQQLDSISYQVQNLRRYSLNWSEIANELQALQRVVNSNTAKVDSAQIQSSEIGAELQTLAQLQSMSQNAQGSLQATQAQTTLMAMLTSQVAKQRELTLAAIYQDRLELQHAQDVAAGASSLRDKL